jgi:hypothetical protein
MVCLFAQAATVDDCWVVAKRHHTPRFPGATLSFHGLVNQLATMQHQQSRPLRQPH